MMTWDNTFVKREYRKALFPIMFSVLGGTVNTLIDSAFVSQSEGADALAAVNLCMPIYLVLCVVGVLFASGASTFASHEIGKNRPEEAVKAYFSALIWYVICGAVITVVGVLLAHPMAELIAQGSHLTQGVYDYGLVTLIGTFPTIVIYLPIRFLQLDGKPRSISWMIIVMLVSDVALDYVFLFPMGLGIRGAAVASVVSTAVACVYGFVALQRGQTYRFSFKKLRISHTKKIIVFGSPSALGNFVDALKMIILNGAILATLGAPGAAVWGALNSLAEISLTISTGVPQTAAPMIGVYYPSRENTAIRSLVKLQLKWGLSMMGGYGAVLLIANVPIAALFKIQDSMLLPIACLVVYMLLDMIVGLWCRYLNTIGYLINSNILSVLRRFVFPSIFVYAFLLAGKWLWLFLPVSSLFTILAGIWMLRLTVRWVAKNKKKTVSSLLLLDDELEKKKQILDFSIHPNAEEVCDAAEKIREFCELHDMDSKLLMRLSLSIEEILMVLINRIPNAVSVDLRAFVTRDETGIQIRIAGEFFDPFEAAEEDDNEELMGVVMMKRMATMTNHYYALGMNTLHIFFEKGR